VQHLLERVARPGVVPGQRRRDVHGEREARRGGVEPGRDDPDHAALLQVADPMQRGGRGEADRAGQLHVGHIGIRLEEREQMNVNFIKRSGHTTEE